MSKDPTIIILGGGIGGIATATALRKQLPRSHRILLVERERQHVFAPSLLWLMVGLREPQAIQRPFDKLARKGIEVRTGEVERIDPETRQVTVNGEVLQADNLVVTLGADLAPELVPGLAEAGHNFYTLAGAESFRDGLKALRKGRVIVLTAVPAYKCPAAPYEAALLIDHACHEQGLGDSVSVEVYAAEPMPMGVAGAEMSNGVKQLLQGKGIAYHPEHQVTSVDAQAKRLTFANGAVADFDLLAYVPPHRAPAVVRDSGMCGENGWVAVDRHTLETRSAGVYAIGDVVSIPLTLGKPLPKAGVFAHAEAEVVAHNIACAINGKGEAQRFLGNGECFIEVGGGKAGFGGGDFYGEPKPVVTMKPPARRWHLAKVAFEKSWLHLKL